VGGENILPTIGPIPLGRSVPVRGFTPDIGLFAPEICLMELMSEGRAHGAMLPTSGQPSLAPRLSRLALRLSLAVENQRRARMKLRTAKNRGRQAPRGDKPLIALGRTVRDDKHAAW